MLKLRENRGITLIALVTTIIILLILAGITILQLTQKDILKRAKESEKIYNESGNKENTTLSKYEDEINKYLNKQSGQKLNEKEISNVKKLISDSSKTAQDIEVNYAVATNLEEKVIIPSENNGGATRQEITQTSLGATNLKWYILDIDEDQLYLISQPTEKSIAFKGFSGYDNCLYYLDRISKKMFTNSNLGVTEDRVHAFGLSDIREATKIQNGWTDEQFEMNFINQAVNNTFGQYTPSNKKYPKLYGTSTGMVTINNPMFDEFNSNVEELISSDSGITASTLTLNGTSFSYYNNDADDKGLANQLGKLGTFGSSPVGKEVFNASQAFYWIASRWVVANNNNSTFGLRRVRNGCLQGDWLCNASGYSLELSHPFRVVVSVPGDRVYVDSNGSVTIR